MKRDRGPIFVEQSTYRHRRMADAARVLPIIGGMLFILPLLWGSGEAETRTTSVIIYLFLIWVVLAGVAALLSSRLRAEADPQDDEADL